MSTLKIQTNLRRCVLAFAFFLFFVLSLVISTASDGEETEGKRKFWGKDIIAGPCILGIQSYQVVYYAFWIKVSDTGPQTRGC